jgi:transcriptional regulator with XRE-family HTH domain
MDLGLTQQTLARNLGCWYQSVARWERDLSEPLAARWPSIEAALGVGLVPERSGLPGRVRAARLRLGLTQEDLAGQAGVHVRTVRNTERGTYCPSSATLSRLEEVLGRLAR